MSFNLRRDMASDGDNRWEQRRDAVAALVQQEKPSVLATQEGLAHQLADLDARIPGYERVGRDRRGDGSDEHNAVYYDPSRLILVAHGDLWLSDTPEKAGSTTWGNRLPRMVTWARFTDQETGASFTLANTHLDHESPYARERAARFLVERFPHAVFTGDFNDAPGTPTYRTFVEAGWKDAGERATLGTFHAFSGQPRLGRIDWVLVPDGLFAEGHRILTQKVDGRHPSDHFPIVADLVPAHRVVLVPRAPRSG